ncbi:TIGR00375 family protein [Methanobacterium spitsbergense]|uniref:TIGR00375 family protein n=1 Tax=Methanobacterium spitsbergense TaxID=2874285 RepID=A0A8T5UUT0_9EURY|nr:TIGR00375 family protein [Methanobacterium spitsbergense]MBZ2164950.1 TIGR00375 family protein [Methanobacterium spitsbergense]
MIINADLHIHGRYSIATSKNMIPSVMAPQAKLKGLDLVATGDALHQKWMALVEETTEESSDGIFSLKDSVRDQESSENNESKFILTTEVEDIKRVHHLIIFPSIESAKIIRSKMKGNMDADGRPRVRMNGKEIMEIAHEYGCIIGPAHAFTPWTSIYKEYDSIKDCYGKMPDFLELGLSADSDMADTIEELQNIPFLTNSDAHSPWPHRLGREFNELEISKLTFEGVRDAILNKNINANYGFDPRLGKYHLTACSKCYTQYAIEDAIKMKMRCPCGGKIKKGVDYRIHELSKWKKPHHPMHRPPYIHILPLAEIISITHGKGVTTVFVQKIWKEMVMKFNDEITALIHAPMKDLKIIDPKVADVIKAFRNNTLQIKSGGGGEYGEIILPTESQNSTLNLFM